MIGAVDRHHPIFAWAARLSRSNFANDATRARCSALVDDLSGSIEIIEIRYRHRDRRGGRRSPDLNNSAASAQAWSARRLRGCAGSARAMRLLCASCFASFNPDIGIAPRPGLIHNSG